MKAKNFEIGKIYTNEDKTKVCSNQSWIITKISDNHVVAIRFGSGFSGMGIKGSISILSDDYNEVSLTQLRPEEIDFYKSLFPKTHHQTGCTCDINALMSTGCTCGWLKHEKDKS